MRYNRAVGRQARLGWMPLERIGRRVPLRLRQVPSMRQYFNAGVNMAYGRGTGMSRGDTMVKPRVQERNWSLWGYPENGMRIEDFARSQAYFAYGQPMDRRTGLGDLFNDVMGAIVPGWDQRSEALKRIVVKPNPTTLLQMANKVAPNAAGDIIGAANRHGLDVMVQTPLGLMPMNQAIAQGLYAHSGIVAQAQSVLSSVPMWVWLAGAGGAVLLFGMRGRS